MNTRTQNRTCRLRPRQSRYAPLETLEHRILLAANWAPFSLVGRAATLAITGGTGIYASSGNALFAVSSAGPTYYLLGLTPSVADSYGNYTYTRTSGTTGTIIAHDTIFGVTSTDTFTYTSASGGTYAVSGSGGTQFGFFSIVASPTGTAPLSVANDRAKFQISAGHGALAAGGNYTITTVATGNSYVLAGSPGLSAVPEPMPINEPACRPPSCRRRIHSAALSLRNCPSTLPLPAASLSVIATLIAGRSARSPFLRPMFLPRV